MYHAFNPTEMEILAGYIWGCQHIEVPVRGKNDKGDIVILEHKLVPLPAALNEFDLQRPYTPLERFLEAVKVFVVVKKVRFENCNYHANNNTIEAIGKMDAKREAASRQVFEAIKNWDESFLEKMWKKHKNTLTGGKLNFAEAPAKPLEMNHSISELEQIAENPAEVKQEVTVGALTFNDPSTSSNTSAESEKKRRGMPKGGWPKKDK